MHSLTFVYHAVKPCWHGYNLAAEEIWALLDWCSSLPVSLTIPDTVSILQSLEVMIEGEESVWLHRVISSESLCRGASRVFCMVKWPLRLLFLLLRVQMLLFHVSLLCAVSNAYSKAVSCGTWHGFVFTLWANPAQLSVDEKNCSNKRTTSDHKPQETCRFHLHFCLYPSGLGSDWVKITCLFTCERAQRGASQLKETHKHNSASHKSPGSPEDWQLEHVHRNFPT